MLKRLGMVLIVLGMSPLIIGGGGMGPGVPGARKVSGPAVSATIVIDPHMAGTTSTAKRATIRLEKGSLQSGATFEIPSSVLLTRGCDLHLTDLRFVYVPITRPNNLYGWVPFNVVTELMASLGITLDGNTLPIITDIDNDVCTVDPSNPGVPDTGNTYGALTCPDGNPCSNPNNQNIVSNTDTTPALAGILSFKAVIQFEVPQNH